MKKKFLLFLLLGSSVLAFSEEKVNNAIYAWVDGQSTCYQLSSMPKVTYSGSQAILSFADETTPLVVELSEGAALKIVYGEYMETDIEDPQEQPVQQVGKYIHGGRLLIYKDGKIYDVNGNIIQ